MPFPGRNGGDVSVDGRKERLAINLFDLGRLDPAFRSKLLFGKLNLKAHIDMRFDRCKEADEAAVEFTCPLLEAALVCDILRNQDRQLGDFPIRLYIKRKAWSRVPSHVVLTVVEGGRATLSSKVFPINEGAELAPPEPLVAKPLVFGRDRGDGK